MDFESLIIVRFFLSNIICCLKSRPLNLLIVLINFFLLSFNLEAILKINDKLKRYGPRSKNLSETLEYILNRNK